MTHQCGVCKTHRESVFVQCSHPSSNFPSSIFLFRKNSNSNNVVTDAGLILPSTDFEPVSFSVRWCEKESSVAYNSQKAVF